MDYHSLTRRELQTLCKKNKIPANITNVAMADALKALQFVEGIDEFSNPSESVTGLSSIESPEKMEVTSPRVPRTGGRTTRRKAVKDEVENSQTLTRTRRSTRKSVETPAATNNRKAPMSSVRRKMDFQLKEVEEENTIGSKGVSETPSVLPSSRRRGRPKLMDENTTRTYSTRRSARLSEKNKDEKIETVKSKLFSEEYGENVEIPESSNDLGEVIETTDIDLKEESEGDLERNNVKEFNSDKKSDASIEDQTQFESNGSFVVISPEMKTEDNGVEYRAVDDLKTEVHSEILEEKDPAADIFDEPLEVHDEVQEQSGGDVYLNKSEDELENGDNLDINEETVSENLAAETVENVVLAQDDAFTTTDEKALEVNEETTDLTEGGNTGSPDNQTVIEEVLENKVENDMGFHDFADDAFTTTDEKALEVNEETTDLTEGGNTGSPDNQTVIEEVLENVKVENDMGFQAMSADDNVEVNKCSEDFAALDITDGDVTEEDEIVAEESVVILPKADKQAMDLTSAQELNAAADLVPELIASDHDEIAKSCDVVDLTSAQELTASADLVPELTASDNDEMAKSCDVVGTLEEEEEEYVDNNPVEETETTAMELNASGDAAPNETYEAAMDSEKSPIKQSGIQEEAFADDDVPFFTVPAADDDQNVIPTTCLTPTSKKSASKNTTTTPLKKSASKKTPGTTRNLSHIFYDKENIDKENIDSSVRRNLILLTKEEKKNKDFGLSTQYIDVSLRKLKKELKEKLETGKILMKDEQVVSSRPALQAVSENTLEKNNNPQKI